MKSRNRTTKLLTMAVAMAMFGQMLIPAVGLAQNRVDERGDPMTIYVPRDTRTIQEAINMVPDGGTVRIAPGSYPETVGIVGKRVNLVGHGRKGTRRALIIGELSALAATVKLPAHRESGPDKPLSHISSFQKRPSFQRSQALEVSDSYAMVANKAREATSTIIPPGKKAQCPTGRILVTQDMYFNQEVGSVIYRDLDQLDGQVGYSAFDPLPSKYQQATNQGSYVIGGNDHDLVTLANGDVLYIHLGRSRIRPRGNLPGWFADTYRGSFGPGARSCMLVWRSVDGGETFQFLSLADMLFFEDGSGAMPQFRRDQNKNIITAKPYDMGGTDGPYAHVDRHTNRVYIALKCVGYEQDASATNQFKLSTTALNKTLVLMSEDQGATWKSLGFAPGMQWRGAILGINNSEFILSQQTHLVRGQIGNNGKAFFDSLGETEDTYNFTGGQLPSGWNDVIDIRNKTLLTRWPGSSDLLISYPNTFAGKGHGYRVYAYRRQTGTFHEIDPILPVEASIENFVFHVTAIDFGSGPVLLYWHDMDYSAQKVTIRGRLISENSWTSDFAISKSGRRLNTFTPTYWLGHYHTAHGYYSALKGGGTSYNYFPMWTAPGDEVRFAKISYQPSRTIEIPIPELITIKSKYLRKLPGIRRNLKHRRLHPEELKVDPRDR